MLSKKVEKALNEQLNAEVFSAYLYFSMSAYFKTTNLDGFAHWMFVQAQEELTHAQKFYQFILQRGANVALGKIDAPQASWESPLAAFEAALGHEQMISGYINARMETAIAEKDHATQIFLQWFVTEQVEEEENAAGIVQKLKQLEGTTGGLFLLDRELGQRAPIAAGTAPAE